MIILIGGTSHTGKTLLSQKLLEKYKIPYTSIDHIKMGLVRSQENCPFTPLDSDEYISGKLWGVIKGIIDTCYENNQNIILEGCYMPPDKVKEILCEDIIALYLVFSEDYIENNFQKLISYENAIEFRQCEEERSKEEFVSMNNILKEKCKVAGVTYIEIKSDYEKEIKGAYEFVHKSVLRFEEYKPEHINEISDLFYDTVHTICVKDYSKEQLYAWATGTVDKMLWNKSLSDHYTIVAKINGKIVGFGDIDGDYFDRLYVHKDYQNQGIARSIADRLEKYAILNGADEITVHASITAKPFFEKRGYRVIKEQYVERYGVKMINFEMKKI